MSASRAWAGLRSASNSHHANTLSSIAKKASTDVVDSLVQQSKRARSVDEDDGHSTTWLAHSAAMASSDFGTDMDDFAPGGFLSDVDEEDIVLLDTFDEDGGINELLIDAAPSFLASANANNNNNGGSSFGGFRPTLDADYSTNAFVGSLSNSSPLLQPVNMPSFNNGPRPTGIVKHELGPSAASSPAVMGMDQPPVHLKAMQPRRRRTVAPKVKVDAEAVKYEREIERKLAQAAKRGDTALIRQIKNSREKVRRAKMCTKFEELHDVVTITNQFMSLSATGAASPIATAAAAVAARNASEAASAAAAAKSADAGKPASRKRSAEKKKNFKKAEVLHNAIETIKEMQAQIEALAHRNAALEKKAAAVHSSM